MTANRIEGNQVCPDHLGHHPVAEVLRMSEASVARIVLLRLDNHRILHEIRSLDTDLRPVTLSGDVIALDAPILATSATPSMIAVFKLFSPRSPFSSSAASAQHRPPSSALPERWASELNLLELYSLTSFLTTLTSRVSSHRRILRCTDVILGKRATSVSIRPHDRAMVSHWEEHDAYETFIAAVFPER
ncbi:hypothetical protein ARMGADRAFT_1086845 [Armillaria gallica]|uniref:Uncharacterized protein n=1 Tax=Armillaria gallica TaxID=47427 RepID=A0A2H3D5M2_ARMGA|nr:hypothetical protein ARMGADRAFT_1086845 [Armillaria gallica]